MMRFVNLFAVVAVVLTSIALYRVKHEAKNHADRITSLRHQIAIEKEAVSVLRAEWSYLNQPDRVQRLANRYLDLQTLNVHQVVTLQDLPERSRDEMPFSPKAPITGFAGGNTGTFIQ